MKLIGLALLVLFLSSCAQNEKNGAQSNSYFDIKGYFEKEAVRLKKLAPLIQKSVSIDGISEQKKIKIENYKKEFNNFISADINKVSWRGDFVVKIMGDLTQYSTLNNKIPVKELQIRYKDNVVKSIRIIEKTENILYYSSDTLSYFPDSLYEIKKTQKIKLLTQKKYVITGIFK